MTIIASSCCSTVLKREIDTFCISKQHDSHVVYHSIIFGTLFKILWLWPAYIATTVVCNSWYASIAEQTAWVFQKDAERTLAERRGIAIPQGNILISQKGRGVIGGISEAVYRSLFLLFSLLLSIGLEWFPRGGVYLQYFLIFPRQMKVYLCVNFG